jgi:hypothetical protein
MTEEKGGSRNRKGRRRYFQTKKDGKPQGQGAMGGQAIQGGQGQRSQDNRAPAGKARKARRRARSRQRYDDNRTVNLEAEVAYVAPQAVYIYEHSVHPELRDAYEFRPDHFSKVGRTLGDYDIDLSKLFPGDIATDGTPVLTNMLPKPQYDWSGWEEDVKKEEIQAKPAPGEELPAEELQTEVQIEEVQIEEVQTEDEKG